MKKVFFLIPVVFIVVLFLFLSGYRLTAISAVEAHSFLNKGSKLIQIMKSNIGDVYIYRVKDYYLTIVPEKKGFLWVAPSSTTTKDINDKNDKVRTIGWASYSSGNKFGTIIVVDVQDDKVSYIEAGPESERIRKGVEKGKFIVFEWNKGYFSHDIKPIALSDDGNKLYMFGYDPSTPNFTDSKELRWHKIK